MLIDRQAYGGQRVLNRYFFGTDSGMTPNAADLADEFVATFLPYLQGIQVDTCIHQTIQCVNLSNTSDYVDIAVGLDGNSTDEGLPPYVAIGFIASQPGYGLRPAKKRIAGIPEAFQDQGIVTIAHPAIVNVATQLGTALEGDDATYYPVTVTMPSPADLPLESIPMNRDALDWGVRQFTSTQMTRRQYLG